MPYIKPEERLDLDLTLEAILTHLRKMPPGAWTYTFYRLMHELTGRAGRVDYSAIATTLGVVESAKLEFYRRAAAPYEDLKIKENGDV